MKSSAQGNGVTLSASTTNITRVCPDCGAQYLMGTEHKCPKGGSSQSSGDELIGAILGDRYRIVSPLTRGGMGALYKAQHTVLNKPLAIKIMLQPQDEAARQRFLQEAKLASSVRHPNIVDIVDFGVLSSQQPYLVMELLVGQTLADAIQEGPLSAARTCLIGAQVARGLSAVHEQGIIHRDLKPANIFLIKEKGGKSEVVKVVDFGIATVVQDDAPDGRPASARLTVPGMVLGTAEYMSPEQAQGFKTDHRVDQYALGCILYEMLTGRVPHTGATPAATMLKHITEKPTPPSKVRPELRIPASLDAIVARAMEQEPKDRFANMHELEVALGAQFEELRGRTPSSSSLKLPPPTKPTQLVPRQVVRIPKPALIGAAVLAAIVVVGIVTTALSRRGSQPSSDAGSGVRPTPGPRMVRWQVSTTPPGAEIIRLIDNAALGRTPWGQQQPAGEGAWEVELRLPGYQPKKVRLDRTVSQSVEETLSPAPQKPSGRPGGKKGSKRGSHGSKLKDNDDLPVVN